MRNPFKHKVSQPDKSMTFDYELNSFNFSSLSDEARVQIRAVIRADNEKRAVAIAAKRKNRSLLLDGISEIHSK